MVIFWHSLPGNPGPVRHASTHGGVAVLVRSVALLFFAVLPFTSPAWAVEETAIAVLSPDIGEPYRQIFTDIIGGIEEKIGTVVNYPVRADTDIAALQSGLSRQKARVVIALGRQGMKTAVALDDGIKVVAGGVLTVPEDEARGLPVISLSPDPALLFSRMKSLMPGLKRVFVVYDPGFSGWLMKLARESASAQGLNLEAYEARDLRSAVRFYQKILSDADSRRDALWLPQDPTTVDENSVLPLVLQQSWDNSLAVFSSNVGHVRRGVLFSLYPNNAAMGESLGELAQSVLSSGNYGKRGVMPLRDVLVAVNLRTAQHLGLNLARQQKGFDSVFPEP